MSADPIHNDVFDPTTDPRHKPTTAIPGVDTEAPRPKNLAADAPPPPAEPVVARPGRTSVPRSVSKSD